MKYLYRNAAYRESNPLLARLDSAAHRLCGKLMNLKIETLGISEYNQRYLAKKLKSPVATMNLYGHLLLLSLAQTRIPLDRFVFVDYGGGCGILSLLAKELGLGRVIYNDIYDVSCRDIKIIARAADIPIDDYVPGDIDDLAVFLNRKSCPVHAIGSFDVIEHLYDLDHYLEILGHLSTERLRLVFASTANPSNPFIKKKLRKLHLEYEYSPREMKWGHKKRDSLESFFQVRKTAILENAPGMDRKTAAKLARSTRGLILDHVKEQVEAYRQHGRLTYRPDHPTNTCDPYTGNGTDNLLDFRKLAGGFEKQGFKAVILGGYWPYTGNRRKRTIRNILNTTIRLSGERVRFLSPYYVVYADRVGG